MPNLKKLLLILILFSVLVPVFTLAQLPAPIKPPASPPEQGITFSDLDPIKVTIFAIILIVVAVFSIYTIYRLVKNKTIGIRKVVLSGIIAVSVFAVFNFIVFKRITEYSLNGHYYKCSKPVRGILRLGGEYAPLYTSAKLYCRNAGVF